LGKQFQKMRRRLTVTGASQNIDGVSKLSPEDSQEMKKHKKTKEKVSVCFWDFAVSRLSCPPYKIKPINETQS
jgi:hypothetical protein